MTAVSGFAKPGSSYNIDNIIRGQIGDDAYFIARHVDEWSSCDFDGSPWPGPAETREVNNNPAPKKGNADVIGVADGVGGWRAYGVDPGLFSNNLMRNCERLVKTGFFISNQPKALLEQVSFINIFQNYFFWSEQLKNVNIATDQSSTFIVSCVENDIELSNWRQQKNCNFCQFVEFSQINLDLDHN